MKHTITAFAVFVCVDCKHHSQFSTLKLELFNATLGFLNYASSSDPKTRSKLNLKSKFGKLLAKAIKKIMGSSKVTEMKTGHIPDWVLELEPVRKLNSNVGSRIRNCVFRALEKDPPRWAKKRLELSISKEVYKGNASGPTKRAVASVLADLEDKIVQEKAKKKKKIEGGLKIVQEKAKKKRKNKSKKEEGGCIVNSVADLVMKQCRVVLRGVAAADRNRIFCNLTQGNDNDDKCLLGCPEMGSSSLDFRSIDLRLADGSYRGSHEAFYNDVQQIWSTIRTTFNEQPDSIKLAERLMKIFEVMYDKEVLRVVQKTAGCASSAVIKESESLILKGICKVCGLDKDNDNVILCDGCDSGYHRYCIDPPVVKIPEGKWYCLSCVASQLTSGSTLGSSWVFSQCKLKEGQRLNHLAKEMMIKDCELNREEVTICLQCGDVGFDNGYVYCVKCVKFAVHRYCLPEIPKTFDEYVHWVCDDCEAVSSGSAWQKALLNTQDDRCTKRVILTSTSPVEDENYGQSGPMLQSGHENLGSSRDTQLPDDLCLPGVEPNANNGRSRKENVPTKDDHQNDTSRHLNGVEEVKVAADKPLQRTNLRKKTEVSSSLPVKTKQRALTASYQKISDGERQSVAPRRHEEEVDEVDVDRLLKKAKFRKISDIASPVSEKE